MWLSAAASPCPGAQPGQAAAQGQLCDIQGSKQLPGFPAILHCFLIFPTLRKTAPLRTSKGKYRPGKMCHCRRILVQFTGISISETVKSTRVHPGVYQEMHLARLAPAGPLAALSPLKVSWQHCLDTSSCFWLHWQDPKASSACRDHRAGEQHQCSAFLFAQILYNVQSQAVITFQASQTENSPCTTAACCEETRQALCFAPRKAHLLIKCRKHFQQGVYWESHGRSYLFELVLLIWGHSTANWCCKLRTSTMNFWSFFSP